MATMIRPELSRNNKYWISKHRYYELKHFCLQYPLWKSAYAAFDDTLYDYILKAVTEELSYTYLRTKLDIPCGRDMYYDRYRRFFWLLSNARD